MKYRVVRRKDNLYYLQFWVKSKGIWMDSVSKPFTDKKKVLEQRNLLNKVYGPYED